MKRLFIPLVMLASSFVAASAGEAADMAVTVEIPRLNVSEYHRPYVAVWIQDGDRKVVANLAVWYQMKSKNDEVGTKWLPDLRQWWRRTGRSLELPVDGVSGATRPAGKHTLEFTGKDKQLASLKSGKYTLVVEAAREVGGREMVDIEFDWPASKPVSYNASGEEELGEINLSLEP
ncbi:DUF2271 domain-containing protein [Bremerella cremea]|uniref:DUF2271 domain-containing protein n=1 Tax=Bremerella cremea TaxID=1031537 RepID=UPI003370564B